MNELILQKMRHAYEASSLGEWKLTKTGEAQLKLMQGATVIAVVNRLEDALFIEHAHRYFAGLLSCIRNVPQAPQAVPATPILIEKSEDAGKKKAGRPPKAVAEQVAPVVPALAPVAAPAPVAPTAPVAPVAPTALKPKTVITPTVVPKGVAIPTVVVPETGTLEVL